MKNKYNLIIIFGKAGAGKDTLLQTVYKKRKDDLNLIISDTTRPPRDKEVDGVDYNFVSEDFFLTHKDEYLEYTKFNNWYYGTRFTSLSKDKINIGVMNLSGIKKLYEYDDIKVKLYYVSAPEKERILRQINREKYPDIKEICRRFLADEEDFGDLHKYPFIKLRNSAHFSIPQCTEIIEEGIDELLPDLGKMS